jgi:HEAT repeat protein
MKQIPPARESTEEPVCPFCGTAIDRPKEPETHRPGQMPVERCASCGAVYTYDVSGRNLGAAFVEALVFACNLDWDLAWSLLPEEDYLQQDVKKYDIETHRVVPGGFYQGRKISGALFFVRLQHDLQEVTQEGVKQKLERAAAVLLPPADQDTEEITYTKTEVEELVRAYQVDPILRAARHDKKTIRHLQRLLCSNDDLLRLRAAEILGRASAITAATEPKAAVALLQGLFYPFTYSNASSWGAIEAIGEIIANVPTLFAGYISQLYQFLEDEQLQPKVLWALSRIAMVRPDLVRRATTRVLPFTRSANPETRGYALWFLGNLGVPEARESLTLMEDINEEVNIYEDGQIVQKTLSQLIPEGLS